MKPLMERVLVGTVGDGKRLLLEMEAPNVSPLAEAFVWHIDRVRTLLVRGRLSPDEAHAELLYVGAWMGRAVGDGIEFGMRKLSKGR
jgi:predicted trehalose synthase